MILFLGKDTYYLSDYHPAFALNQWKCGQQAHLEGIVVLDVEVCHLTYLLNPTDTNRPSHLSRYD